MSKVFRHGDRTPDETEMFPKDPNKKIDFYPIGYGGLTNVSYNYIKTK
jgi:prostatic aicd phosphatase